MNDHPENAGARLGCATGMAGEQDVIGGLSRSGRRPKRAPGEVTSRVRVTPNFWWEAHDVGAHGGDGDAWRDAIFVGRAVADERPCVRPCSASVQPALSGWTGVRPMLHADPRPPPASPRPRSLKLGPRGRCAGPDCPSAGAIQAQDRNENATVAVAAIFRSINIDDARTPNKASLTPSELSGGRKCCAVLCP